MYVRSDRGGRRGCFFDLTPCCIRTYVGAKGTNGLPPVAARQVGKTSSNFAGRQASRDGPVFLNAILPWGRSPSPRRRKTAGQFRETFVEQAAGIRDWPPGHGRGIRGIDDLYGHGPHKPRSYAPRTDG